MSRHKEISMLKDIMADEIAMRTSVLKTSNIKKN
jgi:hypothetical protein